MSDETSVRAWTADEIRSFGYEVVDVIARHLTELPARPAFRAVPLDVQQHFLEGPLPETGSPAAHILQEFKDRIGPYPFGNGHPGFFGWVNSPPAVIGIFAEALAAAMNPSCAGGNHAAIYVERQVINWFRALYGFPQTSMGLLVSGGSMAALTALAVARHTSTNGDVRASGLQGAHPRLIVYKTREGHGCNQKAIELLGLGSDNIRTIAHDSQLRMDPASLEQAIADDRANGLIPMAVVTSAGTVNTGAIDPIGAIADVCQRHGVWLHADGAYGAAAILSRRYHEALEPLSRCDSVALDPHKWLYVPVEAGFVLIRDGEAMRNAFSLVPPYVRTDGSRTGVGGFPWFSEYGFQQTRAFKALKVWMALKHHGVSGYRDAIEHDLRLADYLDEGVGKSEDLESFSPRSLSIVCFRYAPSRLRSNTATLNEINQAILQEVQMSGRAFLSSTVIDETFWLRACIVNYRATERDINLLIDAVSAYGAELLPRYEPSEP